MAPHMDFEQRDVKGVELEGDWNGAWFSERRWVDGEWKHRTTMVPERKSALNPKEGNLQ